MVNVSRNSPVTRTTPISRGKRVIYHGKSVPVTEKAYRTMTHARIHVSDSNFRSLNNSETLHFSLLIMMLETSKRRVTFSSSIFPYIHKLI